MDNIKIDSWKVSGFEFIEVSKSGIWCDFVVLVITRFMLPADLKTPLTETER